MLRVRATLGRFSNETALKVYAVPESLYAEALAAVEELNNPKHLSSSLAVAVASGRWDELGLFIDTYRRARELAYDPLAFASRFLAERWANSGDGLSLSVAHELLVFRPLIYAVVAISALTALITSKRFRRRGEASSKESKPLKDASACASKVGEGEARE